VYYIVFFPKSQKLHIVFKAVYNYLMIMIIVCITFLFLQQTIKYRISNFKIFKLIIVLVISLFCTYNTVSITHKGVSKRSSFRYAFQEHLLFDDTLNSKLFFNLRGKIDR
jgi:hypothetical protein